MNNLALGDWAALLFCFGVPFALCLWQLWRQHHTPQRDARRRIRYARRGRVGYIEARDLFKAMRH